MTQKIWKAINNIDRLVFTTREIATLTGTSISSTTQMLRRLETEKILKNIMRGLWAMIYDRRFSPLMLIPYLTPNHQSYLSFISALHIYGMISQIPQIITVASTAHTKKTTTPVATFYIHQIEPNFFKGFNWHKSNNFLIATPEKALIDCLYLASRKGKRYLSFPELEFPPNFSKKRTKELVNQIQDTRIRKSVMDKLLQQIG